MPPRRDRLDVRTEQRVWLANPPDGISVCGGFDGSLNNDWTCIGLETRAGLQFTPRVGPDKRPAIWNPAEFGGTIPRDEVDAAWDEICRRWRVLRVYCDPGFHDETDWTTEIEGWDLEHGPDVFVPWPTNQIGRMYPALRRFEADLRNGLITQDGCPITTTHMGNARKVAARGDRYVLAKPSDAQKIDSAVTRVITHEAAADMRAAGWPDTVELPPLLFGM